MERAKLLFVWLICCFSVLISMFQMLCSIIYDKQKAWEIAVASDRQANASFNGDSRETISSRAYRAMKKGNKAACLLCKLLDVLDKGHCEKSKGK